MSIQKTHSQKTIAAWNSSRARGVKKYQEKRRKKLLQNKPSENKPNQISDQQKILNAIYKILAVELKPLNTKCQGNLSGCTHRATEIHHTAGRRGVRLIMSAYFKYLCHNCHRFCTEHSKEAKEIGLSLPINSELKLVFTKRERELIDRFNLKLKI